MSTNNINDKNPNFFIVGAPKCGTTSLAQWLGENPEIFLSPIKEPRFFSSDLNQGINSWKNYKRLFKGVKECHKAIGEASTTYFASNIAVPKIEESIENPKYIVMIRNPVQMAYSLFLQKRYSFQETSNDFCTAWQNSTYQKNSDDSTIYRKKQIDYRFLCLLGEQLRRLYDRVPKERIQVILLDDFKNNPAKEYRSCLDFLDIHNDYLPQFQVFNSAKAWKFPKLGKLIWRIQAKVSLNHYTYPISDVIINFCEIIKRLISFTPNRTSVPNELKDELERYFYDDVGGLGNLLDRDLLSLWGFEHAKN